MDAQSPKVGVGVIIVKDGKVLLLQRKNAHGEGTWSFPGGHLEFNESWKECAEREVLEETGIKINNIRFAEVTNDIFEKEGKHYITIFMISNWNSGEARIMEPNKAAELGWFDWNELPYPLFTPLQNLLKQGFNPLNDS